MHCTSRGCVQRLALIRIACGTDSFLLFENAFSGLLSAEGVRLWIKRFTLGSTFESVVASERSLAVVVTLAFMPLAALALDVPAVRQVLETHPVVQAVKRFKGKVVIKDNCKSDDGVMLTNAGQTLDLMLCPKTAGSLTSLTLRASSGRSSGSMLLWASFDHSEQGAQAACHRRGICRQVWGSCFGVAGRCLGRQ